MSRELFGQALSLHQQGRLEEAARQYQQLLQQGGPAATEAGYLFAFLRYQQGRIGEALQSVQAVLARDPAMAKALLLHGILLHAHGKPAEALAQITAAATRDPGNVETWYSRGVLLAEMGRHADALVSFDKALAIRPTPECWTNRGAALQKLKRWSEALQSFDAALALRADLPQVWVNRARVLQEMGRLDEALAACDRALSVARDFVLAWNERGNVLLRMTRFAEALASYDRALQGAPQHVPALVQRAIALQNLHHLENTAAGVASGYPERLRAAEDGFRSAIALDPDLVDAHAGLGGVLRAQGRLDEAEASYRRALALQPDQAGTHVGLGNVLTDRGDLQGAVACYRRAIALRPNIAEAHNNCGNALNELGQLDDAMACYRQALALMPDLVQARNNIAIMLWNQDRLDEARGIFEQIVQSHPAYGTALENLAALLSVQGDVDGAMNAVCRSLALQVTPAAQRTFVQVIRTSRRLPVNDMLRSFLVRALTEPWGRPADLAQAATELIKQDAFIGVCVSKAVAAWPGLLSAQDLYGPAGAAALLRNSVLCALLTSTQNADPDMERFLTAARRLLLEAAIGAAADDAQDEALPFHGALAQQCFINEYVFSQSAAECRQVEELCGRLATALETGAPVPALWVIAIAAYRPLDTLPLSARLLDRAWPDAVAALLVQQIGEPQAEARLRTQIPSLTPIADGVSRDVRALYEENPYPRWVRTPCGQALNGIGAYLYRKFPHARFQRSAGTSVNILVAGCGTGQHSIEVARRFGGGQVLAIDLSLSSLAYASRKSAELGLTNIEYRQADILKLGTLERRFDLIESAGVLHHMADPWAGWRTLLSLLRPGGFMLVGLYSQIARRDILRARRFIASRQFQPVPEQIRQCRQEIMASQDTENLGSLLKLSDFFSISTCRDLLFHVQEHYVSLAEIAGFLRAEGLTLLGFEINPNVLHAYRQRFPGDPAATDLDQWQIFENENPDTFSSMYQFWIQKPT